MANQSLPEKASPAFSFYPNDFTSGTRTLSLAECGAYIRLLCHQWDTGSVPDDAVERSRILGCSQREADKLWTRVSQKFDQGHDGQWRNARLEVERDKQAERRSALSANGYRGAERRWSQRVKVGKANGPAIATPLANVWQADGLSSSSSSSNPTLQKPVVSGTALARAPHPSERHGLSTLHRRGHQSHAFCSERICVPSFLHEKFVGAVGVGSEPLLMGFYAETVNGLSDAQPIDSDPLKFWPPYVTARWPPQSAQVGTRTAALQRATAEFLRGGQ